MALTKTSYSMITGAPLNIADYIPAGTNVATTDCQPFIQAALDEAAANFPNGKTIVFEPKRYRINSSIRIKSHGVKILGFNAELDYYGTQGAIEYDLVNGTNYCVEVGIRQLTIIVNSGTSSTGIIMRSSYSMYEEVGVLIRPAVTSGRGITLVGDPNGTGPYYNLFLRCSVQGSLAATHTGVTFFNAGAPTYFAPNANTWIGGRIGQCATGFYIDGTGNNISDATVENSTGNGIPYDFVGATTVPPSCVQNNVKGGYIEGALIAARFNAGAAGNSFYNPYATGVVTAVSDAGTENLIINTNSPSRLPTGVKFGTLSSAADVLDSYLEGTWTPTLEGATTPGSYTLSNVFANYIKIGRLVTVNASMTITENSAGTGPLKFGGLPFPKAADQNFAGEVIASNFVYPAGVTNLSAIPTTNGQTSFFGVAGNKSNAAFVDIECADIPASSNIAVSFSYLSPT